MIDTELGDDLYIKLNASLDEISTFPVSGLLWLFVWDTIKDVWEDIDLSNGDSTYGEYVCSAGITLKEVWDKLWANPWGGFDIEDGYVVDWLFDNDLIREYQVDKGEGE
jgi:hypothetical protein